jgi:hypothetical protein
MHALPICCRIAVTTASIPQQLAILALLSAARQVGINDILEEITTRSIVPFAARFPSAHHACSCTSALLMCCFIATTTASMPPHLAILILLSAARQCQHRQHS